MNRSTISWLGIVRLGLVQTSLGAIVVMTTSTLNRIMVVELMLPAVLPGLLVALHYFVQLSRPRFGHGSDTGQRRTPWIIGGMAVLGAGGVLASVATWLMAANAAAGIALAALAFVGADLDQLAERVVAVRGGREQPAAAIERHARQPDGAGGRITDRGLGARHVVDGDHRAVRRRLPADAAVEVSRHLRLRARRRKGEPRAHYRQRASAIHPHRHPFPGRAPSAHRPQQSAYGRDDWDSTHDGANGGRRGVGTLTRARAAPRPETHEAGTTDAVPASKAEW